MWYRGSTGARKGHEKFMQVWIKRKRWRPKNGLQYKNFHQFWLSYQNSCDFPQILKWRPKKGSSSQKIYEIRCESTKIAKKQFLLANSRAVNTNLGVLGLDLHSKLPEPVNFFGTQSSLGGAQFSFAGTSSHLAGHGPVMPPCGAGPDADSSKHEPIVNV